MSNKKKLNYNNKEIIKETEKIEEKKMKNN